MDEPNNYLEKVVIFFLNILHTKVWIRMWILVVVLIARCFSHWNLPCGDNSLGVFPDWVNLWTFNYNNYKFLVQKRGPDAQDGACTWGPTARIRTNRNVSTLKTVESFLGEQYDVHAFPFDIARFQFDRNGPGTTSTQSVHVYSGLVMYNRVFSFLMPKDGVVSELGWVLLEDYRVAMHEKKPLQNVEVIYTDGACADRDGVYRMSSFEERVLSTDINTQIARSWTKTYHPSLRHNDAKHRAVQAWMFRPQEHNILLLQQRDGKDDEYPCAWEPAVYLRLTPGEHPQVPARRYIRDTFGMREGYLPIFNNDFQCVGIQEQAKRGSVAEDVYHYVVPVYAGEGIQTIPFYIEHMTWDIVKGVPGLAWVSPKDYFYALLNHTEMEIPRFAGNFACLGRAGNTLVPIPQDDVFMVVYKYFVK